MSGFTFRPSACALILGSLLLGPGACGNESDGTSEAVEDGVPSDLSGRETSNGPIVLETEITLWSAERLELRYELTNGTDVPVVVWDEAPGETFGGSATVSRSDVTDVLVEEGRPVLFKGVVYRDDCLNPVTPITVTVRPLPEGASLSGTVVRALPIESRCERIESADPSELEFCVGHSAEGDPDLEAALAAGRSQSGEERYLSGLVTAQQRSCVTLSR